MTRWCSYGQGIRGQRALDRPLAREMPSSRLLPGATPGRGVLLPVALVWQTPVDGAARQGMSRGCRGTRPASTHPCPRQHGEAQQRRGVPLFSISVQPPQIWLGVPGRDSPVIPAALGRRGKWVWGVSLTVFP